MGENENAGSGEAIEPEQSGAEAENAAENVFTQADIDAAVNAAVVKAQAEWKKEADEAAELSKLSKDARERKLFEKDKQKFDAERAEFAREKLKLETERQLSEKQLPREFAEMLCGADANATLKNIEVFEDTFTKAVEAAVKEKLKADPPKLSHNASSGLSMSEIVAQNIKKGF